MKEGLFHLSVKMIQRSKGRSATGAIAYRAGIDITDERTGIRFNYSRKRGVSYREVVLPKGAPEKYRDSKVLWNAVEQKEARMNSGVAREFEIALPADLPRNVREQLASDITHYIVDTFGVAAEADCHDPHPRRDDFDDGASSKNYHVHILTSTRVLTPDGFTDKVRALDSAKTGSELVTGVRAKWADMVNAAYAAHGIDKFIDHRSYEERGLDKVPTIKQGIGAEDRAEINARIRKANARIARIEIEEAHLRAEIMAGTAHGQTLPLFLDAPTPEPLLPEPEPEPVKAPEPPKSDPRQLELDFTAPAQVIEPEPEPAPAPREPKPSLGLDALVRERTGLLALKDKASIYGRAVLALQEKAQEEVFLQSRLDALLPPRFAFVHGMIGTAVWQTYQQEKDELERELAARRKTISGLRNVMRNHKQQHQEWNARGAIRLKTVEKEIERLQPALSGPSQTPYTPQIVGPPVELETISSSPTGP